MNLNTTGDWSECKRLDRLFHKFDILWTPEPSDPNAGLAALTNYLVKPHYYVCFPKECTSIDPIVALLQQNIPKDFTLLSTQVERTP